MFIKKIDIAALPDVAPRTRNTGLGSTLAGMSIGDAGVVQYAHNTVRNACKTLNAAELESGKPARFFLVWNTDEKGNVFEITKAIRESKGHVYFSLVARVDRETYFAKGGKVTGEDADTR